MKKTLLCFLFLFTNLFYAQIKDIVHCAGDITFDLTAQKTLLIGNLNPAETTVTYHLSQDEATNNLKPISNPSSFVSDASSKTIYARIENSGNFTTNYFNLIVSSYLETIATVDGISCANEKGTITAKGSGGQSPYQYSLDGRPYSTANVFTDLVPGTYVVNTKDSLGCLSSVVIVVTANVPIVTTLTKTDVSCSGMNDGAISINAAGGNFPLTYSLKNSSGVAIVNSQQTTVFANLAAGTYIVEITDSRGCTIMMQVMILEPTMLNVDLQADNKTLTVKATGGSGEYGYSLDGLNFQSGPVLKIPSYGTYQIIVRDQNGCSFLKSFTINPPAPLIDGKEEITFEFKPGQTLKDLLIEGENIKWYGSPKPLDGKMSKSKEVTLPETTVLVDGTTYYASQTVDGIESTKRLAVTAKLSGNLSTPDFVLPNFKNYPNPVERILSISNTSTIDEIEIVSISGKSILSKKINNTHSEIDLVSISSGFYFLKVSSEGKTKTIKFIKK
ncbi:putative secreted protein (Por secretion system target) [Flavobacterium cutihirudinis]|uniref:Putative secreted protein (Por secretion system target) n=1 Tax=Flavobacterium cutihirudinis TaxID=1265740 RepID=A0A3D9FWP1_9FLAO|nr:T9SS type A sorting domain-containing protein [Flavobacterium cutihirudinis]RED25160.1 putative secreted protein (Por secretion system target) [Flavobacterium cutihirudinis]